MQHWLQHNCQTQSVQMDADLLLGYWKGMGGGGGGGKKEITPPPPPSPPPNKSILHAQPMYTPRKYDATLLLLSTWWGHFHTQTQLNN